MLQKRKSKKKNFFFVAKICDESFPPKNWSRKKNEAAWSFKQSWMFEKDYKFAEALRASRRIKRLQKLFSYPYFNNV